MATEAKQRRNRLYDWKRLFDGEERALKWGRDFMVPASNFRDHALRMAKDRDVALQADVRREANAPITQAKRVVELKAWPDRTFAEGPPELG